MKNNKNKNSKIKVFDFFSGCGGTSAGLQNAGLHIILGIDNDKDAINTFNFNIDPEVKNDASDICEISASYIKENMNKYCKNSYTLFCGCAPCQPFSTQNKKRFDPKDERIDLLKVFKDLVIQCKPDLIFCENVPGLQKIDKDGPLPEFINVLKDSGYFVPEPKIVRAEYYGVPQRRKRLVIIASRLGPIEFPQETHGPGKEKILNVRDIFDKYKLPPIKAGESHPNYPNHRAAGLNELNLRRLQAITAGQGRQDWKENDLILKCHKTHKGHSDVYGRLDWDAPSVTLTTKCTNISNGRFGHPTQDRALSVREAALLQSFSMDFIFQGTSLTSLAKQVGNAVPVELARVFGGNFIEHINKHEKGTMNG